MTSFLGVRWDEWFALAMLFVVVGLPVFFLLLGLRRHHMDDLDCSKFDMFTSTSDVSLSANQQPTIPASCKPKYLDQRPWWNPVNFGWVWITLGIAAIYVVMMVVVFIVSRNVPDLRQSLPM